MGIGDSTPVRFTPRGLADAYDATDVFPGACRKLSNLVFDQSNPEVVIARPGVGTGLTSFAGFTSPGFISIQVTVGNYVYGMLATGLTVGFDQPFIYNISMGSFVTISGVTSGNAEGRPASPVTSGAWTPPSIAIIGSKVIITHPGYTGTGTNFFGVIDISNPISPSYSTVNTSGNPLPLAPTFVANLNNRAYYVIGNEVWYSDVLVPTTMTNAGQSLTLGDTNPITALSGLPVQTTTAGVVAALLAFKSTQIWQVTGDAAITGSLSLNYLSLNIGSSCPRSIVPTPLGTFFAGPDSAYVVNPFGAVMPLTSALQAGSTPDIRQPFGYITQPTRVAAAFAGNIYRICLPTIIDGIAGTFDYWFDTRKMRWNGPHSFIYDCVSSAGTSFILSGVGSGAILFNSNVFPNNTSIYSDNGSSYNVDLKSSDFPKRDDMMMKQVVESTIELASVGASTSYNITAYDDKGNQLTNASVISAQIGGLWGSNLWLDGTLWKSALSQPHTTPIEWPIPLVFNKLAIEVTCPASASIAIGTFFARYQQTGYLLQS